MSPRWVKKRDGRIVPYEEGRVVRAVLRAGRRHGTTEELERLAREMARSVTLFLAKRQERAPETATVAGAMEEALEETGHGPIARAAREWRDWRRKRQAEVRVREAPPASTGDRPATPVEVRSRTAARPWTKQRIVEALTGEADLDREAAEDVARAVEERVFAAGLNQISTTLLRELIDGELFERGFSAQLGKLEVLGLPKPDLAALAILGQGRAPALLEDKVARAALERYAIDDLLAGGGATAHLRGDLHLVGLGRPFRMASGAVDARSLCGPGGEGEGEAARSPLEVVRRVIRLCRRASAAHELVVGVVGLDEALASVEASRAAREEALEVLLDALAAPCPDDLPPSPEVVLVVDSGDETAPGRQVLDPLLDVLVRRGDRGAGVRLLLRARGPEAGLAPLLARLVRGAREGAALDLALGEGNPCASRGMVPWVTTVQVGVINMAGLALGAGRGERRRLTQAIERAVEAALDAFHRRRRRALASVVRPAALPLFGQDAPEGAPGAEDGPTLAGVPLHAVGDALGVVGLDAAMRYLAGEGPTENARVAELAREVLLEVTTTTIAVAARLGLGRVAVEDVPEADAGLRLAALDLDRYPDARDLLGDAAGWDTGAVLLPDALDPLADVRLRLRLARARGGVLVLTRPVLARAQAQDADALAAGLVDALRRPGTGRVGKE